MLQEQNKHTKSANRLQRLVRHWPGDSVLVVYVFKTLEGTGTFYDFVEAGCGALPNKNLDIFCRKHFDYYYDKCLTYIFSPFFYRMLGEDKLIDQISEVEILMYEGLAA